MTQLLLFSSLCDGSASSWTKVGFVLHSLALVLTCAAHIIRNEVSQRSKAICSLYGWCRWAVTGTPIQNQLNDLATLLKFIGAYPYDEKRRFEEDISWLLKDEKSNQEGIRRLQHLSSCLLLRRPKRTIELPERLSKECPVEFTALERETYEELTNRAIMSIDQALEQGSGMNRNGVYVNILQHIEALRLFCDLGMYYYKRHEVGTPAGPSLDGQPNEESDWAVIAQQTFNSHLQMGAVSCSRCQTMQSMTDLDPFDPGADSWKPLFSQCLNYVCAECAAILARSGHTFRCEHTPLCPVVPVSTSINSLEDVHWVVPQSQGLPDRFPSKVAALVADLQAQPTDVKRYVGLPLLDNL